MTVLLGFLIAGVAASFAFLAIHELYPHLDEEHSHYNDL